MNSNRSSQSTLEKLDPQSSAETNNGNNTNMNNANDANDACDTNNVNNMNDMNNVNEGNMNLAQEIVFILVVICAQLFTQAGVGMGLAPTRIVAETFGQQDSPAIQSWYIAAYSLTAGTFILIAGRLGDMFGHKLVFMCGFSWFALWSLLAGISYYTANGIFFCACRGLQGIGPAFAMPNGLAILGRTYKPGPRKNMAFAMFGACAPGGFVLGSVFSSLCAELGTWPWAYYAMCIACCVVVFLSYLVIPADSVAEPQHDDHSAEKFDYLGAFTGVAGLVLFNVAWNQAPLVGWANAQCIVLVILGVAFFIAFVLVERAVDTPLVPVRKFNTNMARVLACVAFGWGTFGIWIYYLWQIMEYLRHNSPLLASAQFSPAAAMGAIAAIATGYLMSKLHPFRVLAISLLAFLVASIITATAPVNQTFWAQTFVSILVASWGMDMNFPAATLILSETVPREQQGIAASLVATVVNYSISLSLGVAGTIIEQVSPGLDPNSYLKGVRSALYFCIGLSAAGLLVALYGVIRDDILANHGKSPNDEEKNAA